MLLNPKWNEKPTEPSLDGFIAWLELQDPKATYCWPDNRVCACGQYAKSIGWFANWRDGIRAETRPNLWSTLNNIAARHHTFGQLLRRCKRFKLIMTMIESAEADGATLILQKKIPASFRAFLLQRV